MNRCQHCGNTPDPEQSRQSRHDGGIGASLTLRQQEIARLVACGLENKEIAWRLGISEQTAKNHVRMIFERLNVRNRTHLALLIQQQQRIEPQEARS